MSAQWLRADEGLDEDVRPHGTGLFASSHGRRGVEGLPERPSSSQGGTTGAGSGPPAMSAGRRSPYNTISRAGAEVAGTPPRTPTPAGAAADGKGSAPAREAPQSQGGFSTLRSFLRRLGRREREPQAQTSAARSSSGFSFAGRGARRGNQTEAQEDLEIALHRALEGNGTERSASSRGPARLAGNATSLRSAGREREEPAPVRGAGNREGRGAAPHMSRTRQSRFSNGALGDEDALVTHILAHTLRGRDVERRREPSSSSSALPSSGPGSVSPELGMPRGARHAARAAFARDFTWAFMDDALVGDRGLQEALEQSRKAHLVSELPVEKYNPQCHSCLTECELCLMEYEEGDELLRLPCLHLFHSACVRPWLLKKYTCPVCQIDVCEAAGI